MARNPTETRPAEHDRPHPQRLSRAERLDPPIQGPQIEEFAHRCVRTASGSDPITAQLVRMIPSLPLRVLTGIVFLSGKLRTIHEVTLSNTKQNTPTSS